MTTTAPLRSPLRWVGGKSRLRQAVIARLPPHTCYVEPVAGAAWVLFGKAPSPVEVLNDRDGELVNFFHVLKAQPQELVAAFRWELVARAEFTRLAALDPTQLDSVARAHRFYYLLMAGWGGELHYPRFQTSITDSGHGNRLIGALTDLEARLLPIHARLRTVVIENLDWPVCLDRYDRPGAVLYLDPPYPDNGCNYVHQMRDWESHTRLAARLAITRCPWILSLPDTPRVRALYSAYDIHAVQATSGMKVTQTGSARVVNREVLITNYAVPAGGAPVDQAAEPTGKRTCR